MYKSDLNTLTDYINKLKFWKMLSGVLSRAALK
jgi:hypothetical protein